MAGQAGCIAEFGQIDILVNNAGMNIREPIDQVTEDHFDQIMDVNLKGLYFLSQQVVAVQEMVNGEQDRL